jgi:predicted metal-dependent hydrolase
MQVEVVRSPRRRRTVEARLVDGVLEVRVPAHLSPDEERAFVDDMVKRFERRQQTEQHDLEARAGRLAKRFGLPRPRSIRWSDRQRRRWGSCSPATAEIRISAALAAYPTWVLDYVIVHELAHLAEPGHDAAFHELVARYPRAERAEGFLIAKGLGDDEPAAWRGDESLDAAGPARQGRLF